jgi:hypothetical protein
MLHKFWNDYHITSINSNHIIAVFYDKGKVLDVVNMLTQRAIGRPVFHRGLPDPHHDESYIMDDIKEYAFVLIPGPAPEESARQQEKHRQQALSSTSWRAPASKKPVLSSWERYNLADGDAEEHEEEWVTVSGKQPAPSELEYAAPRKVMDAWGSDEEEEEQGGGGWTCAKCTFLNADGLTACEVCAAANETASWESVSDAKASSSSTRPAEAVDDRPAHLRRGFVNAHKTADDAVRAEQERQMFQERQAKRQEAITRRVNAKKGHSSKQELSSQNMWEALMDDDDDE